MVAGGAAALNSPWPVSYQFCVENPSLPSCVLGLQSSLVTGDATSSTPEDTLNLNLVGSVTEGDGDEVEAFPGESIAQIQQHLVTDLPVYKPDTILLQLDVASEEVDDPILNYYIGQ